MTLEKNDILLYTRTEEKMYKLEEERLIEFKKYSGWSCMQIAAMIGCVHYKSVDNWVIKRVVPGTMARAGIREFLDMFEGLGKRELRKRLP